MAVPTSKASAHLIANLTIVLREIQLHKIKLRYEIDQGELLAFAFRYQQMTAPFLQQKTNGLPPSATAYSDPYLRRRYRLIAKYIHPDKAKTPEMEKKYTNIMATATTALYDEDVETLEKILAFVLDGREKPSERQKIENLEHQIYHYCVELAQTQRSTMWKLMKKEQEFLCMGRDMLSELENQLRAKYNDNTKAKESRVKEKGDKEKGDKETH